MSLRPASSAARLAAGALALTLTGAVPLALAPSAAHAQGGWLDRAKQRAKEQIDRKAGDAVDRAAGRPADSAAAAPQAGATPAATASAGAAATPAASARPGEGAWSNYDFTPGDTPLFVDDFSQDVVGNFPRRLEFKDGSAEIVVWQGQRWLSAGGQAGFHIPLPRPLPERFTLEFDLAGSGNAMTLAVAPGLTRALETEDEYIQLGTWFAYLKGRSRQAGGGTGFKTEVSPVHVALHVDGDYAKLYVNERRVANVPNAKLGRSNKIYMDLNGWDVKNPRMIANLRVMAGGRKLYDALAATGRVATQGIYFDVASDRIRPESTPTLKEIAGMLQEHPELRLAIEGHTDASGQAAANQALSERRAAAVREALVAQFGVDGARLTSTGLGQSKPVAPNTTPEGRQQNRRVELVRR